MIFRGGFLKRYRGIILFTLCVLGVLIFFVWDTFSTKKLNNPLPEIKPKAIPKEPPKTRAPLSGILVDHLTAEKIPIAVVVENHINARPQSGLNEADLIYETYAEGGITRFLAFYQSREPKEIGPVRSAREYFVEWAKSYNVPFAHVGGSAEAIELIKKLKVYDLNQFSLSGFFWRDKSRFAPHNVYTTVSKLRAAIASRGYPLESRNIPSFVFKDEEPIGSRPDNYRFEVNFNQSYAVTWEYDKLKNNFVRIQRGAYQTDRVTKEKIAAKNVIIVFTSINFIKSNISGQPRTIIKTIGTGNALIFIDGQKINGRWKRESQNLPMKFYGSGDQEIKLNSGTTWVEVVPLGLSVF